LEYITNDIFNNLLTKNSLAIKAHLTNAGLWKSCAAPEFELRFRLYAAPTTSENKKQ